MKYNGDGYVGDRENGTAYGRKNVTRTTTDGQTDTGRTLKLETACTIAPLRGAINPACLT